MPDNQQPTKPPSSLIGRAVRSAAYTIRGVSEAWFGPMQPLRPQTQESKGRIWDYPVAFNLNYQPRATMALSFTTLQNLSDNCGVLRAVIETRKDQLESIEWGIAVRKVNGKSVKPSGDQEARIKWATKIFNEPSKEADWPQFLRQISEQHFVYDAPAIERLTSRGGAISGLKALDGSTISVMLDADGGIPQAPSVAYQQVLKGLPAIDFTTDELLYYPRNRRPGQAYGYPHVAQIYQYVNLAIRRVQEQTMAYEGANAPHGVMEGAPTMTVDQITAMQQYWDNMFTGNQKNRSKTWWVPSGSKYTALDREILFDEFDEWLARVICYTFSVSPTPFIKANNRATAETSQDMALAEGTKPTLVYFKRMFDRILSKWMNSPDLEFVWQHREETDPDKLAGIYTRYSAAGIMTLDEVREELGMDAYGGACGEPLVLTGQGYVPVDPKERSDMQVEQQKAIQPPVPPGGMLAGPPGAGGKVPPGAGGKALPGPAGRAQPPGAGKGRPGAQTAQTGSKTTVAAAPAGKVGSKTAGKGAAMQKVLDTEVVFHVSRPLLDGDALVSWAKGIGINPPAELAVGFLTTEAPGNSMPFVLAENYQSRLVKDDDGFRLYFDSDLLAGDSPSIFLGDDVLDGVDPTTAEPFTGTMMFGPEEVEQRWDLAAFDADNQPTDGQKLAGNYRKGHLRFQGLDLTIENAVGSQRSGEDWHVLMPSHYGYIKGTVGADGDQVDVFLGPNPDSSMVYVIDQNDARDGSFDEHKVMLGFDTWTAARTAYEQAFSDGKHDVRIGNAVMMTMDQFKNWLQLGDTTQPASLAKDVTTVTGLAPYDQGPPITPGRRRRKKGSSSNFQVGEGPATTQKRYTRWIDY